MPVDPRRVKELFNSAVQIGDPASRASYLIHACGGDRELLRRLDALVAAHEQAASVLDRPLAAKQEGVPGEAEKDQATVAPDPPATDGAQTMSHHQETPALASLLGTVIAGRYKLREEIGEGGMGSVYLAEQTQPVKRQVALKLIKPGMDSKAVPSRFASERQALALMDHPNIAKVFDAGTTEGGRPFFVMELVKGIPLTEYCDQHRLGLPERLTLFRQICSAVQHAHQKGIIHRDLKPTNILVENHDVEAVPKIIDFGLAKATSGMQLTDRSLFTAFGTVAGTPLYMAPEQAAFNALDIDTRADIYALGVILYELLTGSTPIRRETFRQAALVEMLRLIREVEPPTPSSRISTSDTLPSIAATRQTEPSRLSRFVRGDLDWIVMKALAKERNRRYESAIALAQDLERFTNHEPVSAGPPTAAYRVRKFARRHRVTLATAGGFALLLVAATAVSSGLAVWANRERVRAVSAEKSAKDQQARAQDREQMAIDAVKRYSDVVRDTLELKNNSGLAKLRTTLLKEPHEFFKKLRDQLQADRETTPDSLSRLAAASFALGYLTNEIGDKQDALRAYEESLAIRVRLARENPSLTEFQNSLADSYANIGILQRAIGRPLDALESFERARAILDRLARQNPTVTELQIRLADRQDNIGSVQSEIGQPTKALESFERARAIYSQLARENASISAFQRDSAAVCFLNIGTLKYSMGRTTEALASFEQARAIQERLTRENPSVTEFQSHLAGSLSSIGSLQSATGRTAEALASFEQARAIRERLTRENPSLTDFRSNLASSHNGIGVLQAGMGRPGDALGSFEQARAILERLARENPSVVGFLSALAGSHSNIGIVQNRTGRPTAALESLAQARAIQERLAREHPDSPDFASSLGGTLHNMATIDFDQRQFDEARVKLTQAIGWQRKALAINPNDTTYRQFLANHLTNLVAAAKGLGRPAEVLASHKQAVAVFEQLARENPSVTEFQSDLAENHQHIGMLEREMGKSTEALESYEQARAILERLAREHPDSPDFACGLGGTLNNMAAIELHERRFREALAKLSQAIEWQRKALASKPNHPTYRQFLANHLTNLIQAADGLGRGDLADQARRELAGLAGNDAAKANLDARLAAVLKGEPAMGEFERIQLAFRANENALYASAARLLAEALANEPTLADDRRTQHAYSAACAAALAASGQGKDDPPPDLAARGKLRKQALEWLKAELGAWAKIIRAGPAESKAVVPQTLQHWKTDTDLAGIRDEKELAKLSEEERAAFKRLWNEVDQLLTKAAGSK